MVFNRVLVLLLAVTALSVASDDLSEECEYVKTSSLIGDVGKLKSCFDSYVLNQSIVDAIVRNLELIGNLYPYVDINNKPPKSSDLPFPSINYAKGLRDLKVKLNKSDNIISKVFRPTMAFINGFHDTHFFLLPCSPTAVENIFADVAGVIPFSWNVVLDSKSNSRILVGPSKFTQIALPQYVSFLEEKLSDKIFVQSVDGKDPFTFFVEFFEEYDNMRFKQARISNAIKSTVNGFFLLEYPADNVFMAHNIVFEDNTTMPFTCVFAKIDNPSHLRSDLLPVPDETVRTIPRKREKEINEAIKNFDFNKHSHSGKLEDHSILPCGLAEGVMNYIIIPTFSGQYEVKFLEELKECVEFFYQNDKPITIWMNHNPGGHIKLVEMTELSLMTDIDPRVLLAYRKTADSKRVFIDHIYGSWDANLSNNCLDNSNDTGLLSKVWMNTEYDDFGGGLVHARTNKMFYSEKLFAEQVYELTKGKRLRNPTELIIVTDGYCCSGCAVFTYNAKRAGSAIIAGYGGTYPNDTKFVAGQCYATTIGTQDWCDEVADNAKYGLNFGVTFAEMYNISKDMKEIIPNDFDTPRIDFHLNYYEGANPQLADILAKTVLLYEESKTKCNPENKNLIYVTDECHVDDPHALTVGHVCGDDGFWNKSTCKILTCQPMYSLDYVANKCVPNICDGRSILIPSYSSTSPSSSHIPPSPAPSSSGSDSVSVSQSMLIVALLFVVFLAVH